MLMGGASWQLAVCKTRCRSYVLLSSCALLIAFAAVLPLTRSFSWSLAASKGSEHNDIHALKSICGPLADKESALGSTLHCTEHRTAVQSWDCLTAVQIQKKAIFVPSFSVEIRQLKAVLKVMSVA